MRSLMWRFSEKFPLPNDSCKDRSMFQMSSRWRAGRANPGSAIRSLFLFVWWLSLFGISQFTLNAAYAKTLLVSQTGENNPDCSVSACLTIQFAIDQSVSGDIVTVEAGLPLAGGTEPYFESITLKTGIHVLSNDRAIIEGTGQETLVTIDGVGPNTILEGFEIRFGRQGISIIDSSIEITRNFIWGNGNNNFISSPNLVDLGGGIFVRNSSANITNNMLWANRALYNGGGIYIDQNSNVSIVSNTISQSSLGQGSSVSGSGIDLRDSTVVIQNNILSWHRGLAIGGVIFDHSTSTITTSVFNNLFFQNEMAVFVGGGVVHQNVADLNFSTTFPEAEGNIEGDPNYVDMFGESTGVANLHIQDGSAASTCIRIRKRRCWSSLPAAT